MRIDVLVSVADYKKPNCYFLEDPSCSQQRAESHDISVLVNLLNCQAKGIASWTTKELAFKEKAGAPCWQSLEELTQSI